MEEGEDEGGEGEEQGESGDEQEDGEAAEAEASEESESSESEGEGGEGEALVLTHALPVGMTEPMQELAYVLYEALVLQDPRAAQSQAWRKAPQGEWLQMLTAMARTVCVQVTHAAQEFGG